MDGGGVGMGMGVMGALLLWFVWNYSTVKMWEHVYSKESTYQPTVWPVVIQYTVFLCSSSISSVLESQFVKARLFDWDSNGQARWKTTFHTQTLTLLWNPRISNDTMILGGERTCKKKKKIAMNWNDDQKAYNLHALSFCFALPLSHLHTHTLHFQCSGSFAKEKKRFSVRQ